MEKEYSKNSNDFENGYKGDFTVKKVLLSFMTGIILLSVYPNVISVYNNTLEINAGEKEKISNKIEQLLESRANIMISDCEISHGSQFTSRSANIKEEQQRNQIAQFRDDLKEAGETYSSTRTNISFINSEKISDSMISVKVKEETYLTIAETGAETGYDADHKFILEKKENGWDIVEDKQLEPSGLMPLSIAEEYVEVSQ